MSAPFLDFRLIKDRLDTLVPGTFGAVYRAAKLSDVTDEEPDHLIEPISAWVIPGGEYAEGPEGIGIDRIVTTEINVLMTLREIYSDPGAQSVDAIRDLRIAVYNVLEKWRPGSGWSPLLWTSPEQPASKWLTYYWLDQYITQIGTS